MHPKRLLVLHMENTTTVPPEFHLHIASVDGAPFGDLVYEATDGLRALNSVPEPLRADDYSSDWDIIFPVSQFLTVSVHIRHWREAKADTEWYLDIQSRSDTDGCWLPVSLPPDVQRVCHTLRLELYLQNAIPRNRNVTPGSDLARHCLQRRCC